MDRKREKRS